MKPHEETWFVDGDGDSLSVVGSREAIAENNIGPTEPTRSRYRLAAQAPAMARLLLELVSEDGVRFADHRERIAAVLRAAGVIE